METFDNSMQHEVYKKSAVITRTSNDLSNMGPFDFIQNEITVYYTLFFRHYIKCFKYITCNFHVIPMSVLFMPY